MWAGSFGGVSASCYTDRTNFANGPSGLLPTYSLLSGFPFFHVSFSFVSLRYEALSLTSAGCFSLLSLSISPQFNFLCPPVSCCFSALRCIKFDLCLLLSPQSAFFPFPISVHLPFLPLLNWCLSLCLRPDWKKRLTLPGLGTPAVYWMLECKGRYNDSRVSQTLSFSLIRPRRSSDFKQGF